MPKHGRDVNFIYFPCFSVPFQVNFSDKKLLVLLCISRRNKRLHLKTYLSTSLFAHPFFSAKTDNRINIKF